MPARASASASHPRRGRSTGTRERYDFRSRINARPTVYHAQTPGLNRRQLRPAGRARSPPQFVNLCVSGSLRCKCGGHPVNVGDERVFEFFVPPSICQPGLIFRTVAPAATRRNWKRKREDLAAERVREKRHQSPEGRWTFPARQRRDRMTQLPSPVEDLTAAVNAEKLHKLGSADAWRRCPCVAYFPISSREVASGN